jgi:hypothetical protein
VTDTVNTTTPAPGALKHRRQAAWRDRNPQSVWAHMALRSGLRRGLVQPQPCAHCGAPKTEAHHEDYDRPLDVLWLCRPCHKQHHAQRRAKA